MKEAIQTANAPSAIGPYSQAVLAGKMLFISGQIPLHPQTGVLEDGDAAQQTRRVMENLQAVLQVAGGNFSHVVKTTVFLRDMADFAQMNEIYASFLTAPFPARATVQVSRLPRDVAVEIDAIAVLD